MKRLCAALLLAALTGCGGDQAAGGLTADESRQLNEAAAMLDEAPPARPAAESATAVPAD